MLCHLSFFKMLHLFMHSVVGRFDKKKSHLLGATPLVNTGGGGGKHRYFAFICPVYVAVCYYMFVFVTVGPSRKAGAGE